MPSYDKRAVTRKVHNVTSTIPIGFDRQIFTDYYRPEKNFFRRYCFQLRLYVVKVGVFLCQLIYGFSQEILNVPLPNFQA